MALVGTFVKHRIERVVGIILRWDVNNPGCLVVRIWSEKQKDYVDRIFHPTSLISLETWDDFEKVHKTNEGYQKVYSEVAMELALITKDKAWFDELTGAKNLAKEGESV